jgi:hypothetical protein
MLMALFSSPMFNIYFFSYYIMQKRKDHELTTFVFDELLIHPCRYLKTIRYMFTDGILLILIPHTSYKELVSNFDMNYKSKY